MAAERLLMAPEDRVPLNSQRTDKEYLDRVAEAWMDDNCQVPDESVDPDMVIDNLQREVEGGNIELNELAKLRVRISNRLDRDAKSLNFGNRIMEICTQALMRDLLTRIAHERENGGIDDEKKQRFLNEAITIFGTGQGANFLVSQVRRSVDM